ncbi:MAG: M1 family metallopeptidase [Acidobacteria bacterium]|nr:M1 family metallopeptidase [Acidobacteriota bacterium]
MNRKWFHQFSATALALLIVALSFTSYATPQPPPPSRSSSKVMQIEKDPHTFASPAEVVVKHLDLDLNVDFKKKQIGGKATLQIDNKTNAKQLRLDTRDLTIEKVTLGKSATPTTFRLGDEVKFLGRPLVIDIAYDTREVTVYYHTSPTAAALQWLEPSQTAGKKRPFLFTQSEAILARTWVPCQDSPGVRMTYHARVQVPKDLLAVMSATNPTRVNRRGVYEFDMPQAVPSYLLALAVGDLAFRPLGKRSGVYAEPTVVDKAAYEFADIEKMMAAAEALYGPYRWQRYDVIVLPPSFPFGGMENPRLTFATPTVLAGDRSLVSLVAHELAHSWSGNLVTNATWNDFWLNEGFTNYFENRIMEALNGKNYAEMLAQLAQQELQDEVKAISTEHPEDTRLHLELAGRDPDEGMTDIAYDKGFMFLRMIEATVGREKWDAFLRKYFATFAFQSMTTAHFVEYLRANLIKGDQALEEQLKIDQWIYQPGLPDNLPKIHAVEFDKVKAQLQAWQAGKPAKELQTQGWTTQHWLYFLSQLPASMSKAQMADLDAAFGLSKTGNSEILFAWLMRAIANKYEAAYPALEHFLTSQGRRKFLKPLYTELAKTAEGKAMAKRIYQKARPTYHSVSYLTIDEILK